RCQRSRLMHRREFLELGAGLIVGFSLGSKLAASAPTAWQPNAWLRIDPAGGITVLIEKSDIGQGIWSGVANLLAEELDADWSAIRLEQAPPDPTVYKNMSTGGSGGVMESWDSIRRAGAQARQMLLIAAASAWHVPVSECGAQHGAVTHPS